MNGVTGVVHPNIQFTIKKKLRTQLIFLNSGPISNTLQYHISQKLQRSIKIIATIQYSICSQTLENLSKFKDRLQILKSLGVAYEIKCTGCNAVYIGETGRLVEERMAEHMRDIRRKNLLFSVTLNNMGILSTS